MPLFSVVIPSYNRGSLITATLDSVFAQDFTDFDVIVVDDGSTDNTVERLRPYFDRITFLRQPNKGPGAARNFGVQHSTAEYIAFLDSDDLWFPWTMATYAQIIKERISPALIAGTLVYFRDEAEVRGLPMETLAVEYYADYFTSSQHGLYCGSGQMVVRRVSILEVGGFTEGKINAEDHDLTMRLGTARGFVNVTSPALVAYRQHSEASTADLSKTYAGSMRLLKMEQEGRYPGGGERSRARRQILTNHLRPLSLALLAQGEKGKAWTLYRQTFEWHMRLGRLRYLAGFLLRTVLTG